MRLAPCLAALAAWLVADVAHACPVCFDANESNRTAFIVTTIFLSLLPLTMIGGLVLWIRERLADHDLADHETADHDE